MSIPFLSKLSRVATKQAFHNLSKTCNPTTNPRVHALVQPVTASQSVNNPAPSGNSGNGHSVVNSSCCCCNVPFLLRYFSSSSGSDDGEGLPARPEKVLLKVETTKHAPKSKEKVPPPACASFNQELELAATTPLAEHENGLNLSRRGRSKPPSGDGVPFPQPQMKKDKKSKKEKDKPTTPGTSSPSPSTGKSTTGRRVKDRLEALTRQDCERRLVFSYKMLLMIEDFPEVLDNILWTDECNFNLPKLPSLIKKPPVAESELLPQIAWCGMSTKGTVGPYFFNSHVTDKSYLKMLESFLIPELEKKGYNLNELWFQQDGAPWHRSKPVVDFLTSVFDYRVISLGTKFIWPPRSQDLTPMDFFFWDYMKIKLDFKHSKYDLCFQKSFRDILTREVSIANVDALQGAIYQLPERLEMCLNENGGRFVHLLYPKRFKKDGSQNRKDCQLTDMESAMSIAKIAASHAAVVNSNSSPSAEKLETEKVTTSETSTSSTTPSQTSPNTANSDKSSTNTTST